MSGKQPQRRRGKYVSCWLLFALALLLVPGHAPAKPKPHPLKQDEPCLACHGTLGMKSDKGQDISIDPGKHAASPHGLLACQDCHTSIKDFPHPAKAGKPQCATCHEEEAKNFATSVHSALGEQACASCHGNAHELAAARTVAPVKCSECHADEVKAFAQSIHGQAAKRADRDAPNCMSCHGSIHQVKAASEPDSAAARKNLAETCAKCHSDPGFLSRHMIPIANAVETYKRSVHGQALAAGNQNAADCANCHGSHDIYPARDPGSSVNHWKVPETCGKCHAEIAREFNESVHGVAVKAGNRDAPVCTDCHGEHLIMNPANPASPLNAANVSGETCGRCHNDPRLALRNNLPLNRVPSYAESYHGLAIEGGRLTAANCASCHGVHDILPPGDPRSTINAANLPKTCGQCHKGVAEAKFTIGPIHVQTDAGPNHPVVQWIRCTYLVLIPATLGFMLLHNLLDLLSKLIRRKPRLESSEVALRMNLWFRIAHWGVMVSFPTLVFTGFALKFPESWWAKPFLLWESSAGVRGGLHRTAAVVMASATLFHFIHLAVRKRDRSFLSAMIPTIKDATDMLAVFRYNLGLTKQEPKFLKFNYAEKMEYWAFLWGTTVMALSGLLLWFNNFTLRHFPKWVTDAATAVHWYEALLATFAILIWHFYLVIFDPAVYPMDTAWIDGKIPADHYRHSRPAYYRELVRRGLLQTPEDVKEPEETEKTPEPAGDD
jgi:formate dehydrogenase gamma subunit